MADAALCATVPLPAGAWWRVHPYDAVSGNYGPIAFNDSGCGNARFSPLRDPESGSVIPTLYAAREARGAIAEVLLHDVPEPSRGFLYDWERDRASNVHMSAIGLPQLSMANLTSTGLRAAGLSEAGLFQCAASTYPGTRALALAVWQSMPSVQGLCWMSVRDNRSLALMLFGDRIAPAQMRVLAGPTPIAHYQEQVFGLLQELGCGLAL